jgi:hypothetical protein
MFAFHNRGGSRQGTSLHCTATSHSFQAMAENAGTTAQRIRYGLTGLAIAFLVVLLGSVISRASRDEPSASANAAANAQEPSEPMAELGVAPGASDTNDTNQD